VAGEKEGFAEVALDDVFRVADGGEVDAGVPPQKKIEVCRDSNEIVGRQSLAARRIEEGTEQFGNALNEHGTTILDC
jgi:hypothetical protein